MLTKAMKEVYANVLEVFLMFGFHNRSRLTINKILKFAKPNTTESLPINTGNRLATCTIRDVLKKRMLEEIVSAYEG